MSHLSPIGNSSYLCMPYMYMYNTKLSPVISWLRPLVRQNTTMENHNSGNMGNGTRSYHHTSNIISIRYNGDLKNVRVQCKTHEVIIWLNSIMWDSFTQYPIVPSIHNHDYVQIFYVLSVEPLRCFQELLILHVHSNFYWQSL